MSWVTKTIVLAKLLLEAQQLVLETLANDRVDRTEGLVHEHQRRIGCQCAGNADPLALTAGKLRRKPVAVLRNVEPHERNELIDALRDARAVPAEQARHRRNVVPDRHVGQQPDLLDDVADAAPKRDRILGHDVATADENLAGRRLDQAVDHLQARRLAAA